MSKKSGYRKEEIRVESDGTATFEIAPYGKGNFVKVDIRHLDLVAKNRWCVSSGYAYNHNIGLMHRIICKSEHGNPLAKQVVVDHINRNKLDNRSSNLRWATLSQNMQNSKRHTLEYKKKNVKGVWFDKRVLKNPWRAAINIDGKRQYLGRFESEELAKDSYTRACEMHFV